MTTTGSAAKADRYLTLRYQYVHPVACVVVHRSFDDYPATMTTDDVAELLGHPATTIRTWCKAGMIPAHRNSGSHIWRFDRDELIGC